MAELRLNNNPLEGNVITFRIMVPYKFRLRLAIAKSLCYMAGMVLGCGIVLAELEDKG